MNERRSSYEQALETCACLSFRKASRAVTQLFDRFLEPSGIRSTQLALLLEIAGRENPTIPVLARQLVMDKSTLTRTVGRLHERGIIAKVVKKGSRSHCLILTEQGEEAIAAAVPLWEKAQAALLSESSEVEWDQVRKYLKNWTEAAQKAQG